jgi:hypothetical protein
MRGVDADSSRRLVLVLPKPTNVVNRSAFFGSMGLCAM